MSRQSMDWTLLGGEDPTPGQVDVVEYIAEGFESRAQTGQGTVGRLSGFGFAIGDAGWEGSSYDGFISAYSQLPPIVSLAVTGFSGAGTSVRGWVGTLTELQAEADALLALAEANQTRLETARVNLAVARSRRATRYSALQAARRAAQTADPPGSGDAAVRRAFTLWDAANTRVIELEAEVTFCEAEKARFMREGGELAGRHEEAAGTVARAVADAAPDVVDLLPFAARIRLAELDALLPDIQLDANGDGIITPAELAAVLPEILDQARSPEQVGALEALGPILSAIAADPDASEELVKELGAEDLAELYRQLYLLSVSYPYNPTSETFGGFDPDALLDPNLGPLLEGLNQVIASGSTGADGREVIEQLLDIASDPSNIIDVAILAGLARVEGLPEDLGTAVVQALIDADDLLSTIERPGTSYPVDSSLFPELTNGEAQVLIPIAISNNPIAIEELIYGPDGFVDGGKDLLGDLLDLNASTDEIEKLLGDSLGSIIQQIIGTTSVSDLIVMDSDGRLTGDGTLFELVDLLLEHPIDGSGLAAIQALAPYLPEITGALVVDGDRYSPEQIEVLLTDLLEDLTPEETSAALEAITQSALAQISESITPGAFDLGVDPAKRMGDLLDGILGPVVEAIENVAENQQEAAAQLNAALDKAFGLIPLPGGQLAGLAIKEGVTRLIDGATAVDGVDTDQIAEVRANLITNAVATVFGDPALRERIVDRALDSWPTTRSLLEGQGLTQTRIEEIHGALQDGYGDLPADVFTDLPQVVDLVNDLKDELVLSPAGAE